MEIRLKSDDKSDQISDFSGVILDHTTKIQEISQRLDKFEESLDSHEVN